MIDPRRVRLSLALPIDSARTVAAATRIVVYLLRTVGRVEIDLLQLPPYLHGQRADAGLNAVLLAAGYVPVEADDRTARRQFEMALRARIEQVYARQGVREVSYDLQIL